LITRRKMQDLVRSYDEDKITICALGTHSALDILDGAKDEGFSTLAVCQRGRERAYRAFHRIVDQVVTVDAFRGLVDEPVQESLRRVNTIFVPHRGFGTYIDYDTIEDRFAVPLFGNRGLLRVEERTGTKNQYALLQRAGIRAPRRVKRPEEIEGPVIVKVQEAKRKIERAFFFASSYADFKKTSLRKVKDGLITRADLQKATIEELVVGTYFNFNYFFSPLTGEVEFLGIDRRLQTNINDFVSLPARQQLEMETEVRNIEVGHMPATIRESMLEKVFEMGEKFCKAVKRDFGVGPIGPFALQGVVTTELDIVIFDISPRVPGSPILATTSPYSKYYFGEVVGTGRRIAMEVKAGIREKRLPETVT
jgi:5-formaminoimidazole-4-carboxamide-1-(beta)-D-ribofuranosyl 5'-monophosphate synthetase